MTDRMSVWDQRFSKAEDVPIFTFPIVPWDHPDLALIEQVYMSRGIGLATDHNRAFELKGLLT